MFSRQNLIVAMAISALIAPFIFYSSSRTPWISKSPGGSLWQELLYPVEYTWHQTSTGITNFWQHYIELSQTAKENDILRKKLARLQIRIMDYEHQVNEAKRLRKLLGFYEQKPHPLIAAEVVGSYANSRFKTLRVTRGSLDGISIGMPVIAADGIIGRVIRTGLKFADVQLLEDSNFHLDVLLERTRVRGVLQGIANNRCRLLLHRRADIRIGDTIITSGIISGFPKGLRVGRVTKINYESDRISQVVTVEPWVDYRRQEEVLIIKTSDKEFRKIIETAGKDWIDKTVGKANRF
ncbi:MAG: rod shape-determining protein MreC [Bdellovibrionota bacterium]